MTKEALKLALEALELNNDEWKSLADSGDSGYWKAEDQDHYKQTNEAITALKAALAQPEYDYKDLYEKEKRRSAMWLAKYEEVAGPAPKAYPLAQPEQEPVACAECERLKDALKRANGLAEHFERAWYLRGDEIEELQAPPPQREWVGLTDERIKDIWLKGKDHGDDWLDVLSLARSFEAELKELNT